jgi:Response regulator containing CheY-like receiver domain and AraC-type DNA-binding domain
MYNLSKKQVSSYFNFLNTLDCYLTTEDKIKEELALFEQNKDREIAAFVSQNIPDWLTYSANYIRIIYVLEGKISLSLENNIQTYDEGCLILANKNTEIKYKELSKKTTILSFYFKPEYFEDGLLNQLIEAPMLYRFFIESTISKTDFKSYYCIYQFSTLDDVHIYILTLLKQVVKMEYYHNQMTKPAFILLITEINNLSQKSLKIKESNLSNSVLIEEILLHIDKNKKNISLKELGAHFHFHPNYLSSLIKEETNQNFSQWLTFYRLKEAKQFLKYTNLSIQEIIKEVGYKDKKFFFKIFKEQENMTPLAYRKASLSEDK